MLRRSAIRLGAALLLFAAGSAAALAVPAIQHWQTRNGVHVYFVETHELPIVDVEVVYAAGSTRDPAGKEGTALLTAGLLDEGAAGVDANRISFEFERLGAEYDVNSNYDSATVSLRSLSDPEKLSPALQNFQRVISSPDFPEDAFDRQRNRLLVAIQQKEQNPDAVAGDAFEAAIYGKHPYAHPRTGTLESVKAITRKDVENFYKQYYVAQNAMIALVGDMKLQQAKLMTEELSRAMKSGDPAPPVPAVPPLEKASLVRIDRDTAQTHILMGQPAMKQNDPDYFPLYVGNQVLGGGGLVSRLLEEIRNKRGLSYSASSGFSPRRQAGPFVAGLSTTSAQAPQALKLMRQIIDKFIKEGPTKAELKAAKENITGGFPLRLDSNGKILDYVAAIGFYGLPLNYLNTFNDKVNAVTIDQIKDAFQRRMHPDRMVTVIVGPPPKPAKEK
jgi:zinc protease